MSKSKCKFAFNVRFLLCKDGAICAKNIPKRNSQGVARAIVKLNSLRFPSPIMAPGFIQHEKSHKNIMIRKQRRKSHMKTGNRLKEISRRSARTPVRRARENRAPFPA